MPMLNMITVASMTAAAILDEFANPGILLTDGWIK